MLPDTVYVLWWVSDWAGDVPADTMVAASTRRNSEGR